MESPPGARAGREGRSRRILPHHSFLTAPRVHPHLLLHKHHRRCVGTVWGTHRGLALGPGLPALHGRGVVEGGGGNLGQTVPPYPYTASFLFQPGLPRHERTGALRSQTCRGSDKLGWFWPVKCYVASGPVSLAFATPHCCSSQAQRSQQRWGSLQARRTAALTRFTRNGLWQKPRSPCWSQMTQIYCFLGWSTKLRGRRKKGC